MIFVAVTAGTRPLELTSMVLRMDMNNRLGHNDAVIDLFVSSDKDSADATYLGRHTIGARDYDPMKKTFAFSFDPSISVAPGASQIFILRPELSITNRFLVPYYEISLGGVCIPPSEKEADNSKKSRQLDNRATPVSEDTFEVKFVGLDQTPKNSSGFFAANSSDFVHGESASVRPTNLDRKEVPKNLRIGWAADRGLQQDLEIAVSSGTSLVTLSSVEVQTAGSHSDVTVEVTEQTAGTIARYLANGQKQTVPFSTPIAIAPESSRKLVFRVVDASLHQSQSIAHDLISLKGTCRYSIFHDATAILLKVALPSSSSAVAVETAVNDEKSLVRHRDEASDFVDYAEADIPWTIVRGPTGGFLLSSQGMLTHGLLTEDGKYMRAAVVTVSEHSATPAIATTPNVSEALILIPELDAGGDSYILRQVNTQQVVTVAPPGVASSLLPLAQQQNNNTTVPVYQHWQLSDRLLSLPDGWKEKPQLAKPNWDGHKVTRIGSVTVVNTVFVAYDDLLFSFKDGAVLQYVDSTWYQITYNPIQTVASTTDGIFVIEREISAPFNSSLRKHDPSKLSDFLLRSTSPWQNLISKEIAGIVSLFGGKHLFGLDKADRAFRFDESTSSGEWKNLTCPVPLKSIVELDPCYYGLHKTTGDVYKCEAKGDKFEWSKIGGPMAKLLDNSDVVYGVDLLGRLQRYNSQRDSWEVVFDGAADCYAARGSEVYLSLSQPTARLPNKGLYVLRGQHWARIGGSVGSLVAGANNLFGVRNQQQRQVLVEYSLRDNKGLFSYRDPVPLLPAPVLDSREVPWVFTFVTSDEAFAGFDGIVRINVFGSVKTEIVMKKASFARGHRNALTFNLPADLTAVQFITISTEHWLVPWFQWHMGRVTALCTTTKQLYSFTVNKQIEIYTKFTDISPDGPPRTDAFSSRVELHIWTTTLVSNIEHLTDSDVLFSMTLFPGDYYASWRRNREIKNSDLEPYFPPDLAWDDSHAGRGRMHRTIENLDVETMRRVWEDFKTKGKEPWGAVAMPNSQFYMFQLLLHGGGLDRLPFDRQEFYQDIIAWTVSDFTMLLSEIMKTTP